MKKNKILLIVSVTIIVSVLLFFLNKTIIESEKNKSLNKPKDLQVLIDFKDKRKTSDIDFFEDLKKLENGEKTSKYFKEESYAFLTYADIRNGNKGIIFKELDSDKLKFLENRIKTLYIEGK